MEREKFGSRIGFILISAGCAIGLGNVWRFPYITAKYGGAAFILMYLTFLVIFGLPIMTMEFAVGRASGKSIMNSFKELQPKGTKWSLFGFIGIAGNYLLMMFYTVVSGWMFIYFIKMLRGDFVGQSVDQVAGQFSEMTGDPVIVIGFTVLVVVLGFLVCSLGLQNGVEKITKICMLLLFAVITVMAVRVLMLPNVGKGLKAYLVPDFGELISKGIIGEAVFAAMGQAFFTLSIGMGSMAIFGSYIKKDRRLLGESAVIAGLDTFVALMAGLIVVPSLYAFNLDGKLTEGPGLLFEVVPNIFNSLDGGGIWGRVWGSLFFLFMIFAAMSTVIAVFENIVSIGMDTWGLSRRKSCIINLFLVLLLAMPCALGFNLWKEVSIIGLDIQGFEDFVISNNILPLGSLVYVLFCTSKKYGWGWDNFIAEANTGKGLSFPKGLYVYSKFILPIILIALWVWGYVDMFVLK